MLTLLRSTSSCPIPSLIPTPGPTPKEKYKAETRQERLLDFFARDLGALMCFCNDHYDKEYARAEDALQDFAKVMQFTVKRLPLDGEIRTDIRSRVIQICSSLPSLFATLALAKEIGHIRLHYFDGIRVGPAQVKEAEDYANVFMEWWA